MSDVKITPQPNGPYKVEGEVELHNAKGEVLPTTGPEVFLCRCGHSANKPFCDGSHKRTGFQDH
ncbi:MAG: CDGSH iron-sulfur domain-containing protein [Sinomicrobium sp.]|nr:CDGSH iron-sulfur domain-containing protein [Sinomicrobium sp.]